MNLIRRLDDLVLDNVFEPIAWRTEARWGVSSFDIARFVLVLWPSAQWAYATSIKTGMTWPVITFLGSIVAYFWSFDLERRVRPGHLNPERAGTVEMCWRVIVGAFLVPALVIEPIMTSQWFGTLSSLGLWLFFCFCACNPMPPDFKKRQEAKDGTLATGRAH